MLSEGDYPYVRYRITVHKKYKEFSVSSILEKKKKVFFIKLLNLDLLKRITAIFVT